MNSPSALSEKLSYDISSQALAIIFYSDISEERKIDFINDFLPNLSEHQRNSFFSKLEQNLNVSKYLNEFIVKGQHKLLDILCKKNIFPSEKIINLIIDDVKYVNHLAILAPSLKNKVPPLILRQYCKKSADYNYYSLDAKKQTALENFIIDNCDLNLLEKTRENEVAHIFDFNYAQDKELELFKNLLEKIILKQNPDTFTPIVAAKFGKAFFNWTTKHEQANKAEADKRINYMNFELLKRSTVINYTNRFDLKDIVLVKTYNIKDFKDFYNKIEENYKISFTLSLLNSDKLLLNNKKIDEVLNFINEKIDTDVFFTKQRYSFGTLSFLVEQYNGPNLNPIASKIINKIKGLISIELDDFFQNFLFDSKYYNNKEKDTPELLNYCLNNFLEHNVVVPSYFKEIMINKMPTEEALIEVFFDKQNLNQALGKAPSIKSPVLKL